MFLYLRQWNSPDTELSWILWQTFCIHYPLTSQFLQVAGLMKIKPGHTIYIYWKFYLNLAIFKKKILWFHNNNSRILYHVWLNILINCWSHHRVSIKLLLILRVKMARPDIFSIFGLAVWCDRLSDWIFNVSIQTLYYNLPCLVISKDAAL